MDPVSILPYRNFSVNGVQKILCIFLSVWYDIEYCGKLSRNI